MQKAAAGAALLLVLVAGCRKKATTPRAMSAEEVPAAMEKTFQQAPTEVREVATEAVIALQSQDESKAFLDLQELTHRPELSPEQRMAAARSMMAVHERLRSAAARGDKKAEQTLEQYQATK
jgi:hypothetical protein